MASPWALPEDLRLHLRLDAIDAVQAAASIAAAETIIRAALQQTIDAVAGDTAGLVGTGRRTILLPEMPVTAVASVTVDGTLQDAGTWRVNRHGVLTRLGGCWPLDADITVVYDHGYAQVPAAVTQVCVQLAGRAWVNPRGMASESIGDWSGTWDKARAGDALTDYEMRLLEPYARGPESR
ncbi:hypothetical protein [Streptomyces leeuwenhoekii]|uniref:hypothetical protein n=1 Tax=Streptomyces leeuwenhoekii TaxID=1437453 RepID=UPI00065C6817|nr:hypothetical protein [Streptomyces leeuwenhoekii]